MTLLQSFQIIKNELDALGDKYKLSADTSPRYADAVTAIDKLCKMLMCEDFAKKKRRE